MKTTFFKNATTCSLSDRYRCSSKVHGVISRYKSIITTTVRTSNTQIYDGMVPHEKTPKTRYNISGVRMTNFGFFFVTTRRVMMMMTIIIIYCQLTAKKTVIIKVMFKLVSLLFMWVMLRQHFVRLLFRTEFISWRSFRRTFPSNFLAIHTLYIGYGAIYLS